MNTNSDYSAYFNKNYEEDDIIDMFFSDSFFSSGNQNNERDR